ncbi:OLC1v1006490C5 [Oldenlandia corymbosa var. corymbosa]|uniref:OLC1v1006490C5 n=1 Tax=Oldenlandia corymbosa var. corymbosa TaxID=529605 RepID=A0AAV1DKH7_OLDCO|nr:OLC1v1006490C5 [Oldenlandia corymbosa var. corymbosa]
MAGVQPEKDVKVSLGLAEEILHSMGAGVIFRDYVWFQLRLPKKPVSSLLIKTKVPAEIFPVITKVTCSMDTESLCLLSLHDNKYLRYFKGHHDRAVSLSLCSRTDCFISGSLGRTVLMWDQRAEKCQGLLRVQGRPATAYDDQGIVFTIAYGGYIRMFDARKYEKGPFEIFYVGGDMSDANVVRFSNNGRLMLLTTSDGYIHVLDSFHGTLLSTYKVTPASSVSTLEAAFSPDGMFFLSQDDFTGFYYWVGSGDGSVHAWSVRSGKEVTSWLSNDMEPPVFKWALGSLMFAKGSSKLSFWIPDLSKLASFAGRK